MYMCCWGKTHTHTQTSCISSKPCVFGEYTKPAAKAVSAQSSELCVYNISNSVFFGRVESRIFSVLWANPKWDIHICISRDFSPLIRGFITFAFRANGVLVLFRNSHRYCLLKTHIWCARRCINAIIVDIIIIIITSSGVICGCDPVLSIPSAAEAKTQSYLLIHTYYIV